MYSNNNHTAVRLGEVTSVYQNPEGVAYTNGVILEAHDLLPIVWKEEEVHMMDVTS